jgi:3'(2'), 5'-bisphosphate nucleotidase
METTTLLEQLTQTARAAGEAVMQVYEEDPKTSLKHDGSPVTKADQSAEAIIVPALRKIEPAIHIVSEENAESHLSTPPDRFFLVDPLDGTKEFLKKDGQGSFTVNIALVEHGVPVLGVVYAPALDRLFCGGKGIGATETTRGSHRKIKIRRCPISGPVAVASCSHREQQTDRWLTDNPIARTISVGSSLKFCLLACGEVDVYPRFSMTMEWDTAAGDAVLRAAGGSIRTPDNKPFIYGKSHYKNGPFIACGGWSAYRAKQKKAG